MVARRTSQCQSRPVPDDEAERGEQRDGDIGGARRELERLAQALQVRRPDLLQLCEEIKLDQRGRQEIGSVRLSRRR
jgi:hypothetical protein